MIRDIKNSTGYCKDENYNISNEQHTKWGWKQTGPSARKISELEDITIETTPNEAETKQNKTKKQEGMSWMLVSYGILTNDPTYE